MAEVIGLGGGVHPHPAEILAHDRARLRLHRPFQWLPASALVVDAARRLVVQLEALVAALPLHAPSGLLLDFPFLVFLIFLALGRRPMLSVK